MEQVEAHYARVSASRPFKAVAQCWHLLVNLVEDIAYAAVMLAIVIWLRITAFYTAVFADVDAVGIPHGLDAVAVHGVDVGTQAGEWVPGDEAPSSDGDSTSDATSTTSETTTSLVSSRPSSAVQLATASNTNSTLKGSEERLSPRPPSKQAGECVPGYRAPSSDGDKPSDATSTTSVKTTSLVSSRLNNAVPLTPVATMANVNNSTLKGGKKRIDCKVILRLRTNPEVSNKVSSVQKRLCERDERFGAYLVDAEHLHIPILRLVALRAERIPLVETAIYSALDGISFAPIELRGIFYIRNTTLYAGINHTCHGAANPLKRLISTLTNSLITKNIAIRAREQLPCCWLQVPLANVDSESMRKKLISLAHFQAMRDDKHPFGRVNLESIEIVSSIQSIQYPKWDGPVVREMDGYKTISQICISSRASLSPTPPSKLNVIQSNCQDTKSASLVAPKPGCDKPVFALVVRIRDNTEVLNNLRAVQNSLVSMDGRFVDCLEAENELLIPLLRLRVDRDCVPRVERAIRTCIAPLTRPLKVAIRGISHDDDGLLYAAIPQSQSEVSCPLRKFVVALRSSLASKGFQVLSEPVNKDWHRVVLARLKDADDRAFLAKHFKKLSDCDKALGRIKVEAIEIVSSTATEWRGPFMERVNDGHTISKVKCNGKASSPSVGPSLSLTSSAIRRLHSDVNLSENCPSTSAATLKRSDCASPIIAVRVRCPEVLQAVKAFHALALELEPRLTSKHMNEASSLHITLAFVNVNKENIDDVKIAMDEAVAAFDKTASLTVTIEGTELLSSAALRACLGTGGEKLELLAGLVRDALTARNVSVKRLPKKLHMTLIQTKTDLSLEHLAHLSDPNVLFGTEKITGIELVTSGEWSGYHTVDHYKVLHIAALACSSKNDSRKWRYEHSSQLSIIPLGLRGLRARGAQEMREMQV